MQQKWHKYILHSYHIFTNTPKSERRKNGFHSIHLFFSLDVAIVSCSSCRWKNLVECWIKKGNRVLCLFCMMAFFFVLCQLYGIVLLSTPSIWITAFDSVWCLWKAHKPYDAFLLCSDFMRFSHDRPIKWKYAITMSASTIFHSKYTALTYFSIYFSFYQSFLSLSLLHTQTQKRWEARIAFSIIMIVVENGNHCHKSSSSTYFSFFHPFNVTNTIKSMLWKYLSNFRNEIRFGITQVNLYFGIVTVHRPMSSRQLDVEIRLYVLL